MDRRSYLRALGAVGIGPTLAGCGERDDPSPAAGDASPTGTTGGTPATPGDATGTPEGLRAEFGTVVNVAEEGADTSGEEPVDSLVERLTDHDTLLYFPPGRYRVSDIAIRGPNHFGMLGEDATFVLDRTGRSAFLSLRRLTDFHFQGFTVDNTAPNTTAWVQLECVGGDNVVRDYAVKGFGDVVEPTFGFTLTVQGGDTSLLMDRVDLSAGAINGIATFVFPQREFPDPDAAAGELTFRNCVMKNWGAEGLYASAHRGPIRVLGGEYANNSVAQVRVGSGNAPERSVVRDVTVRVTKVPEYAPEGNRVLRGIWMKEGDRVLVENCDVTVKNLTPSETPGGIVVNRQFGRATIRDTSVSIDVARPAVVLERPADSFDPLWMPSLDRLPREWSVTCENLSLVGSGASTPVVDVIGRDGCRFRNVGVRGTGGGTDGYRLRDVADCRIAGGSVRASRFPVMVSQGDGGDCLVRIDGVPLVTGSDPDDERLAVAENGQFCITPGMVRSAGEQEEWLGLTRTTRPNGRDGSEPTRDSELALFGRALRRG